MAASNGSARCVHFLIKMGPDGLKAKDHQGHLALDTAKKYGHVEAAKIISVREGREGEREKGKSECKIEG